MAKKFVDLNVPSTSTCQSSLLDRVQQALQLGYQCIAVNDRVDLQDKDAMSQIDPPRSRKTLAQLEEQVDVSILKTEGLVHKLLTRVTGVCDTTNQTTEFLQHRTICDFDLISLLPRSRESLVAFLEEKPRPARAKLISVDPAICMPDWLDDEGVITSIVDNKLVVELCYSAYIVDSSVLNDCLVRLRPLLEASHTRGLSLVLSSGCQSVMDIRAPIDVVNSLGLWNVPYGDAHRAVSQNPLTLLESTIDENWFSKPMVQLVSALNMKVRKRANDGKQKRRTKRKKKMIAAASSTKT